jgi:hypothetical protein
VLAWQDEWRRKISEHRAELAERFGHRTQARDLLAQHSVAERLVAAE